MIGGIAAAPFGGYAAKRIPPKGLLIMVGTVLVMTSLYGIWTAIS